MITTSKIPCVCVCLCGICTVAILVITQGHDMLLSATSSTKEKNNKSPNIRKLLTVF